METSSGDCKLDSKYYCKICEYSCNKSFLWKQHVHTIKHNQHILNKNGNIFKSETNNNHTCETCKKSYKSRAGLWKHKKKCVESSTILCVEEKREKKEKKENSNLDITELLKTVMKDNNNLHSLLIEQQKQIGEMIPRMGNNNNNKFNLNFFLNEQCKNAINWPDFLDSLSVQLEDLQYTKNNGYAKGITQVFVNGLKQLDVYNRPIHCTDTKRTVMYVKDEGEWEKDQECDKMKKSIAVLNKKHITAIKAWENKHPNWFNNDKLTDEYMAMVRSVTSGSNNSENMIIKNVAKEVIIDKD